MFNYSPYCNRNYRMNYYSRYNFIPTFYPNVDYKVEDNDKKEEEKVGVKENVEEKKEEVVNKKGEVSRSFKLGPFSIHDNNINIFGFNIAIDDLIILLLIALLLVQSDTDYMLIIVLGLILLNIDFSSLDLF